MLDNLLVSLFLGLSTLDCGLGSKNCIGEDANLMTDCNQVWGVDEAIDYMKSLSKFNIKWIEEPTARDDVQGHLKIARELDPLGIKVAEDQLE